jgi:hypothetical protein
VRGVLVILFFFCLAPATHSSADESSDVSAQRRGQMQGQMSGTMRGRSCFDICTMRVGPGPRFNTCLSKCQANREMRGGSAGGAAGNAPASAAVRQACAADAERLCSKHFGNRPAIVSCMRANSAKLSAGCIAARKRT